MDATYFNPYVNRNPDGTMDTIKESGKSVQYPNGFRVVHHYTRYDIIKGGVCMGIMAGPKGAEQTIDTMIQRDCEKCFNKDSREQKVICTACKED